MQALNIKKYDVLLYLFAANIVWTIKLIPNVNVNKVFFFGANNIVLEIQERRR